MKKVLLVGATLSLLSTSAMASQARLLALGMNETDNDGMYHIEDRRNIFLNPAWLNVYNDYVTLEYGKRGLNAHALMSQQPLGQSIPSNARMDNDAAPKAQGGFFKKHGSLVYGLYLGAESNTSSLLRLAGTSAAAVMNGINSGGNGQGDIRSKMLSSADNQFDLFIAGDTGMKWGGNVTFARGKDDSRSASDLAMATRWGVMTDRWDAHLNLSLASKSKATDSVDLSAIPGGAVVSVNHELKGKLGFQLGGSYKLVDNQRVFGYIKHYGWEQSDDFAGYAIPAAAGIGGQQGTVKGDFTSAYLGWGNHYQVDEKTRIYTSFAAKKTDINAKFDKKGEIRHLEVPVSIAFETQVSEWATLRGSITQAIYSQRDNKNLSSINPVARGVIATQFGAEGKGTMPNTTQVKAGATLTFGQIEVDGLLGATKTGQLDGDDLFSRAALTYNF